MQTLNFKVASCNQTKEGKFVWKLIVEHVGEAFGVTKTFKRTYYIGGMPKSIPVGNIIVDTLDKFNIQQRPVAVITDPAYTAAQKTMDEAAAKATGLQYKVVNLSWLHLKPTELKQAS